MVQTGGVGRAMGRAGVGSISSFLAVAASFGTGVDVLGTARSLTSLRGGMPTSTASKESSRSSSSTSAAVKEV